MRTRDIATLAIPGPEGREMVPLRLDPDEKRLLTPAGAELDRDLFLTLRDRKGAMILADDPTRIRKMLRLRASDRAVVERTAEKRD